MAGAVAVRVEVRLVPGHCSGSVWEHMADVAKQPLSPTKTQAKARCLDMFGYLLAGRVLNLNVINHIKS